MIDTSSHNDQQLHWYAMWVYRSLVSPVVAICQRDGVQTYRPMRTAECFDGTECLCREEPLVANLLFVKSTAAYVSRLKHDTKNRVAVYCSPGTNIPAPISDDVMTMFMLVVKAGANRLEAVEFPIDKGDKVRVLDGIFKGAEGYIRRVHGTKRLVVAVEGVVAVAVTHIPRQFLERIEPAARHGLPA